MESVDTQRFRNDLLAGLMSGVPMMGLDGHFLSADQLETIHRDFDEDPGAETIPNWYTAATTVFVRTGSMLPVLEGLSIREHAVSRANRSLRWTFFYLMIVIIVALIGLCLFYSRSVWAFELFRDDFQNSRSALEQDSLQVLDWLPGIIIVLAIIAVLMLLSLVVFGTRRFSLWVGGHRYVQHAVSSMTLRISRSLLHSGLSLDNAISVACDLTGSGENERREISQLCLGATDEKAIGAMVNCESQAAHHCLAKLRVATPLYMVALLGGGLTLLYCLMVFLPIFWLMNDMISVELVK